MQVQKISRCFSIFTLGILAYTTKGFGLGLHVLAITVLQLGRRISKATLDYCRKRQLKYQNTTIITLGLIS